MPEHLNRLKFAKGDSIQVEVGTEQDGQTAVVAVGYHHEPEMAAPARRVDHGGVQEQARIEDGTGVKRSRRLRSTLPS